MSIRYGEYAGFLRKGGKRIGYQKLVNGRMQLVKDVDVPEDVRLYIEHQFIGITINDPPKTPEELFNDKHISRGLVLPNEFASNAEVSPEVEQVITEAEQSLSMARQALDEMTGKTIYDAPLADIAEALFERFGIYTCYLNRFPNDDEINPFTAAPMTKYEKGVAYQSYVRVMSSGVLNRDPEAPKKALDQAIKAHENVEQQFTPAPSTFAEDKQSNSFEYRTSVEGDKDRSLPTKKLIHYQDENGETRVAYVDIPEEEHDSKNGAKSEIVDDMFTSEPIVQPQFGKQVIRPNW